MTTPSHSRSSAARSAARPPRPPRLPELPELPELPDLGDVSDVGDVAMGGDAHAALSLNQLPPRPPIEYPEFLNEPRRSASCFRLYCNLGPNRSLRQVAQRWRESNGRVGVNFRQVREWSSKFAWVRRSAEFDLKQESIDAWYEREQRRLLNLEQEKLNKLVERRMLERLAALLDADERYEQDLAKQGKYRGPGSKPLVGALAAVQWYTRAGDMRRLALGADVNLELQQQQLLQQQLAQQQQDLRIVIELDGEPPCDIVDAIPVYQPPQLETTDGQQGVTADLPAVIAAGSYDLNQIAPGIELDSLDSLDGDDESENLEILDSDDAHAPT